MLEKRDESRPSNLPVRTLAVKSKYLSPTLVEYGSVAKLTQSGAGSGNDGNVTAGMMMNCL